MNALFYIGFVVSLLSLGHTNAANNIEKCFKRSINNLECLINSNYGPGTYKNYDNVTWYVEPLGYNISDMEVVPYKSGAIYVCGTEIPQSTLDQISDVATEVLIKMSDLFLCAHLALFFANKKKKNLACVTLASFVVTLLAYFVMFDVAQWMDTCRKASIVLHYLQLCLFTWMLVMSYECWLTIAYHSTKFRPSGSGYWNRFVVYCLLSLLTPLVFVAPAVYLDYTEEDLICNIRPGYGRLKQCFIAQERPRLYFYIIPSSVIFAINISLFVVTVYMLYRMCNDNIGSPVDMKKQLLLFGKIGLLMGMTWTLGTLVHFCSSPVISLIYSILNSSQGIAIFFMFSFKIEMLKHRTSSLQEHLSGRSTNITRATSSTTAI